MTHTNQPLSSAYFNNNDISNGIKIFGIGSCFFFAACDFAVKMWVLSSQCDELTTAASGLIFPIQGVTTGVANGYLVAIGRRLGVANGNKDSEMGESLIKTAWILSLMSSASMALTAIALSSGILPYFIEPAVTEKLRQYFICFALSMFAEQLIIVNSHILFQVKGDWKLSLVTVGVSRMLSALMAYVLAVKFEMGVAGVGLAASMQWLSAIALQTKILTDDHFTHHFHTHSFTIPNFLTTAKEINKTAFFIALQRLAEWLSMLLLGILIGMGNRGTQLLKSAAPSLQLFTFSGVLAEGVSQGGMLLASIKVGQIEKLIKGEEIANKSFDDFDEALAKFKHIIILSLTQGALLSGMTCAMCLLFTQALFAKLYPKDISQQITHDAHQALYVAEACALLDAVRIISMGMLRSCDDLKMPMINNFILMVLVGLGLGFGAGEKFDQLLIGLFVGRTVAATCATANNLQRLGTKMAGFRDRFYNNPSTESPVHHEIAEELPNTPL